MSEELRCEICGKYVKVLNQGIGELMCCGKPMILLTGFRSSKDVLDFAIEREQEAERFYRTWAQKSEDAWIKKVFNDFAKEEQKHKELLLRAQQGESLKTSEKDIADLKIGDYLIDVSPGPDMSYQKALIIAMKREKASFRLYSDLARMAQGTEIYETLHALAQEEAKHKVRLETMYDDDILGGN